MSHFRPLFRMRAACVVVLLASVPARADVVELKNGDVLHGRVISVDDQDLKFASEAHGAMRIERGKVSAIHFGDAKPAAPAEARRPAVADPLRGLAPPGGAARTPEELVEKLGDRGIQAGTIEDLQQRMPLLAVPEVRAYFDKKVGGLQSGELDLTDIRKDAIRARDELQSLQKDLGPDGAALGGYLHILNNFIDQTDPAGDPDAALPPELRPQRPPSKPAPDKQSSSKP